MTGHKSWYKFLQHTFVDVSLFFILLNICSTYTEDVYTWLQPEQSALKNSDYTQDLVSKNLLLSKTWHEPIAKGFLMSIVLGNSK